MKRMILLWVGLISCFCLPLFAAEIVKGNNTEPLNTGASWIGDVVPGAGDVAVWDSTVAGANDSPLENDATWDGIKVTNPGGAVTVSGAGALTLDGGAAIDINLSAATQDLTLAAPVTMGGTIAVNVNAGRTLTFAGPLDITTAGNWGRVGLGTVVFDGPVSSTVATTLELQRGTNIFTGKNGGLSFTSTASTGSRIYVGRYSGSESTLIISNGVHETRGTHDEANANLIGVTSTGHLIMEGGSLTLVYLRLAINNGSGTITVNNGRLEATAGSDTAARSGYALMIGNNHKDDVGDSGNTGSATLTVNGGEAIFTNGIIKLGCKHTSSSGALAVTLNGGTLATRRFYVDECPGVTKTFTLNGGLLRLSGGGQLIDGPGNANSALTVNVGDNGANIDTGANDLTLTPPLLAAGSGGLVKSGSGTLTLAGANTYTGKTRVQGGMLGFSGAAATAQPDLFVASGAGVSLRDNALTTFSPSKLAFGTAAAVTLEFETAADSSACDRFALPAGATFGRILVAPVTQGTTQRPVRSGDYAFLSYAGAAPDISLFSVPDPAPNRAYSFVLDEPNKAVVLRITYASAASEWIAPGSGAWETAANWTAAPANAAGTAVRLGPMISAPATVTASAPVTLGSLAVNNANAYTLAGPGYTFDNNGTAAPVNVEQGTHTVTAPLTLTDDLSISLASGTALSLNSAISGTGALVKQGAGELTLTQANSYAGGTRLLQSSLIVSAPATLGSGSLSVEGVSGLRITGATPMTLANDMTIAATTTINTQGTDLSLPGTLEWLAGAQFMKTGTSTLRLSGNGRGVSGARFFIENGTLCFASGADYVLESGDRDTFQMQRNNNAYARTVVVEPGANVDVNGFYMEYGASNTVVVNGGTLNMRGGGSYGDVILLRANSAGAGTDRFIVNSGQVTAAPGAWFNIGIRGGMTARGELIVNGGTTTLGRVSMGVRLETGGFGGNGRIEVNGGLLDVTESFNWMADNVATRTNRVVLGNGTPGSGVLRLPATRNTVYTANGQTFLLFNGGTLETSGLSSLGSTSLADYLYGVKHAHVGPGGARIDTQGLDITITQPLQPDATPDGGLTKLGAGSLTLTGACSFTGPTVVEAGALALPGAYASEGLTMLSGTELNLANETFQTLSLTAATLQDNARLILEASANSSACDCINLPSGASVGALNITVVQSGTTEPIARPGDYTLFTFADATPPNIAAWTLANPASGRDASFAIVGNAVVLRVAYMPNVAVWTTDGSGDWDLAANWTALPANAAGASARFDSAISAPAAVSRASASTLGTLAFNNIHAYTLTGAALTMANIGDAPAVIATERGTHTVNVPVTFTGDARIQAAAGAAVALNSGISGSTTLTVEGPGALALPDIAGLNVPALTLTGAGMVAVAGTDELAIPVSLGAGGGGFAPAAGETLDVVSTVSGAGGLIKSGSGFLKLTSANALYSGDTTVTAGTLFLDTLPPGGFVLGQGTLHYTGSATTTPGGYTLDTGDAARAAVLHADSDITFQGTVSAVSGALVKTGAGTMTFTAAGENVFNAGAGAGDSHSVLDIGPYGDSPTTGFSGFNIVNGKVVLGAPGQTNHFNSLAIGLNSTAEADAETAGELEIVGGVSFVAGDLAIGRGNGNTITAPTARTSKLRMTDGELTVDSLTIGNALANSGYNATPALELSGGLLTVNRSCWLPTQVGADAAVTISGGKLDHKALDNSSIRCCQLGGALTLTLSGTGELVSALKLLLSYGANGETTLNLDGGVLQVQNIEKGGSGLSGVVNFNSGVYRPSAINTLQNLTAANMKAGGARFDLSLVDRYTLTQTLTHDGTLPGADGGLTKTGAGTLILGGKQAYDGPTMIAEGALRIPVAGGLSNVTTLAVAPGAALEFDSSAVQTIELAGLTLGEAAPAAPASLQVTFAADGTGNDTFAVSGPVALGEVSLTLLAIGQTDSFALNGTYTLLTYTGATPDVSGLRVASPLYGKAYTFAADAGAVTLTIAADSTGSSGAVVWSAAGGGSWQTSGNWSVAPANTAGERVRFDGTVTAPATIAVNSPVVVGEAYFNNANTYTIAGPQAVSLDNGAEAQAVVKVEAGAHVLAAPVVLSDAGVMVDTVTETDLMFDGTVSGTGPLVKAGAGTLTVTKPSPRDGVTEMQSGSLVLKDGGNPGIGELIMRGAADVRVTGSTAAELPGKLTIEKNMQLNAQDNDLAITGELEWLAAAGTVTKIGTNALILAGTGSSAGSAVLNVRDGTLVIASGADYALATGSRETLKLGAGANAKTALVIEEGATLSAGGISLVTDSAGIQGGDALVTQNGGDVYLSNIDALFVRHNGTATGTYMMNGGTLTMPSTSWANIGYHGLGVIKVNGGLMSLGRVAPGYQERDSALGKGAAEVYVNGGRLEVTGQWSWMSDGNARRTEVLLNGGTFALPATMTYGTNVGNWTALTLNGGTLELAGMASGTTSLDNYLSGARSVRLDADGGTVYTRGLDATVRQNVQALCNTGGVTLVGGGTLTLAGTNRFWGVADVQEGTLKARIEHCDLPGVPLFWYRLNEDDVLADASGHGFTLSKDGTGEQSADRNGEQGAYAFNHTAYFQIPHNARFQEVTAFTAAAWMYVPRYNGSYQTILSARPDTGTYSFEFKLNSTGELRLLEHSTGNWWQDIMTNDKVPLNQWVHVAVSVSPQGAMLYINGTPRSMKSTNPAGAYTGVGWPHPGDIRLVATTSTAGIRIGRSTPSSERFDGSLDDVMLYDRVLSDAEVAQLYAGSPLRRAAVRVADMGVFDLMGGTQAVSEASGSGQIINGTLAVEERLSVGDSDDTAAGAVLTVDNLSLGTNAVYVCSIDGNVNDKVDVRGTLTIDGAGVIDFGRTEANPIIRSFTATVMTYDTIINAVNLADWTVGGLGRDGFQATVTAEDGEVVVRMKSTFGTLMILK